MNLAVILDENISPSIADFLHINRPEWDVWHVRDVGLRGSSDATIFQWAQRHKAIVITFDEDFADTRMYPAVAMPASFDSEYGQQLSNRLQRPSAGS